MEPIARNIIQTLEDQNLISCSDIVDGSTVFLMGRQRNRFFVFKQLHGPSFFIKQAHEGEAGTSESVALEAQIYQAVAGSAAFSKLQEFMPRFLHFDPNLATLTLELIKDAEDVGTRSRRLKRIAPSHAAQMGAITAHYHAIPLQDIERLGVPFDTKPHWVFRLEETPSPLPSLRGRSKASADLIDMIRAQPDVQIVLERCRTNWASDTLIHGDLKWENFLVTPSGSASGAEVLKIIDWERANIGDPAWDVGCGLAAFVIYHAMQTDITPAEDSAVDLATALDEMHPFWAAYQDANEQSEQAFFEKCIDMLGARLIVAAYEYCYCADEIPPLSNALIDLARTTFSAQGRSVIAQKLLSPRRQAA